MDDIEESLDADDSYDTFAAFTSPHPFQPSFINVLTPTTATTPLLPRQIVQLMQTGFRLNPASRDRRKSLLLLLDSCPAFHYSSPKPDPFVSEWLAARPAGPSQATPGHLL